MTINFTSFKDSNETRNMHTKSNNIEIMIGNETNEFIKTLFGSLLQRHYQELEKSTKGSESIFDSLDLLYYKFHR